MGEGGSHEEAKFYPAHPRSEAYLNKYWKKLHCIDDEVAIAGDYQSDRAVQLQLLVIKCNAETKLKDGKTCKSE